MTVNKKPISLRNEYFKAICRQLTTARKMAAYAGAWDLVFDIDRARLSTAEAAMVPDISRSGD